MVLAQTISNLWNQFQRVPFPDLAEEIGSLTEKLKYLAQVLDLAEAGRFVPTRRCGPGRPQRSRQALARAFVARAIWDLPTIRDLIDRLMVDATLRRLCGWPRVGAVPREETFSRAFAEFSEARLAERMHEALVKDALGTEPVGHVSRDSTEIRGGGRGLCRNRQPWRSRSAGAGVPAGARRRRRSPAASSAGRAA